jgi:ElaB/YqjD/DUF883 family membrane-anchored ribosome-binding protein
MDHESEVIKQQMEQTRTSLAEKLEALEEQVASTVHKTTDAVANTVENVKEAVEETVETVSDSVEQVKETFDVSRQVQEHPWLMLGGAVVAGYIGSSLLQRGWSELSKEASTLTSSPSPPTPQRTESTGNGRNQPAEGASQPNLFGNLTEGLSKALGKVEELALGVTSGLVGRMILESVPEAVRGELEQAITEFTRTMGGTPMPGLLHPKKEQKQEQKQEQNPALARASAPPPRS